MIFKLMYLLVLNVLNLMVCLTLLINCNYIIIFIGKFLQFFYTSVQGTVGLKGGSNGH